MKREKSNHESYGMLGFSRVQHHGATLFGSSIRHNNTIQMTVKTASFERNLSNNYYFGDKHIVTIEMSPTQFYEAIANMNVGDGIPVTIRTLHAKQMEECPFDDVRQKFEKEFKETLEETSKDTKEAIEKVSDLINSKKPLTKSEKEELLRLLTNIDRGIGSTAEFIYSQFNEQMDKTVSEAKGEVEAFVQNKITSLGIEGLKKESILYLESEEK